MLTSASTCATTLLVIWVIAFTCLSKRSCSACQSPALASSNMISVWVASEMLALESVSAKSACRCASAGFDCSAFFACSAAARTDSRSGPATVTNWSADRESTTSWRHSKKFSTLIWTCNAASASTSISDMR